jgi:DNA-binding CsgD family transcriptional regulator
MFSINVTRNELDVITSILWKLNQQSDPISIRNSVLTDLSKLFNAEFIASFVMNDDNLASNNGVYLNINNNLYEEYCSTFYKSDVVTPRMRMITEAKKVNDAFTKRELLNTEHYNEFLLPNNMYYGLNIYFVRGNKNLGDLRIWRTKSDPDFSIRDVNILQALSPYFESALTVNSLKFGMLTQKEKEILKLIADGLSDKDIANLLYISHATVRTHIKHTMEKLNCKNRTELAIKFYTPYDLNSNL